MKTITLDKPEIVLMYKISKIQTVPRSKLHDEGDIRNAILEKNYHSMELGEIWKSIDRIIAKLLSSGIIREEVNEIPVHFSGKPIEKSTSRKILKYRLTQVGEDALEKVYEMIIKNYVSSWSEPETFSYRWGRLRVVPW